MVIHVPLFSSSIIVGLIIINIICGFFFKSLFVLYRKLVLSRSTWTACFYFWYDFFNNYLIQYWCFAHPDTGIAQEKLADKAMTAVNVSTTGYPRIEGLRPVPCFDKNQSGGSCSLAAPNEWSHGAHWYRSSAVLLRYHKWVTVLNCH